MRLIHILVTSCYTTALLLALSATPTLGQSVPQEGIKVHGDWTLTVRNPDGTVAAVHEFKNALVTALGADRRLASMLGGDLVPGQWVVGFGVTPSDGCGGNGGCYITEMPLPTSHSTNLTKTIPTGGLDFGKLVLRGSVRMVKAASISIVFTQLTTCAGTTAPNTCAAANYVEFTRKSLDALVPVAADQLVEVKVVISFS